MRCKIWISNNKYCGIKCNEAYFNGNAEMVVCSNKAGGREIDGSRWEKIVMKWTWWIDEE